MKPFRQPQRRVVTAAVAFTAAHRALEATPSTRSVECHAALKAFDAARDELFAACDALAPPKAAR